MFITKRTSLMPKRAALIWCSSALVIAGCQGYSMTGGPGKTVAAPLSSSVEDGGGLLHINSIVVGPLQFGPDLAPPAEAELLDRELENDLRQETGVEVSSWRDLNLHRQQKGAAAQRLPNVLRQELIKAAAARGFDAVLETQVKEFVERRGSVIGSDQPALVSFTLSLLKTSNAEELWRASYNFQDQALTDNLLRIGQTLRNEEGGRGWKTARSLLLGGFQSAAKDLVARRLEQFAPGSAGGGKRR